MTNLAENRRKAAQLITEPLKTALVKNGGRIADAGSVMFQFTRKGVIRVTETGEDALLTIL